VINPTASGIERVHECAASHVLPGIATSSSYAKRGTEIAAFIRRVLGGMSREESAKLVTVEAWRATCVHLDFAKLVGDLSQVRGEMAYALDVETDAVRELGSNIGRGYPALSATEIGGTDDIEGMRIDDVPVVIDVKTGQPVTRCQDNPQIKFFARILQLRTGAAEVEGRIAYVREDGQIDRDCYTFSAFELDSFGDELAALVDKVSSARAHLANGGTLTVSSGDHCTYCPAMASCPRYTSLARTMVSDVEQISAQLEMMTPEQQGVAWEKARAIEKLLDVVVDGLKALAKQSPIPLANGKTVKPIDVARRSLVQESALSLLRTKGATAAEIDGCYASSTVVQVREVGGAKALGAPKRKGKAA
jgi:hypothetical protein